MQRFATRPGHLFFFLLLFALTGPLQAVETVQVNFELRNADGGALMPGRFHLFPLSGIDADDVTAARFLMKLEPWNPQVPRWADYFNLDGSATVPLPPGRYRWTAERGPEFGRASGEVQVDVGSSPMVKAAIGRIADLAAEGWWSGELHVHRPMEIMPLLMRADDLHIAPVITWWNRTNLWDNKEIPAKLLHEAEPQRLYRVMAGEDEREAGALMFYNLPRPLEIKTTDREWPSPMRFVNEARQYEGVHIDIEKPFWWDVPIWVASGQIDSIGLANNHMGRNWMYPTEAWGRPRDEARLPRPRGNGFWTQEIYYHLLSAGIELPPSAGSASGVMPNPIGYNRVYVYLGQGFGWEQWFEGLRAGRSFVTNGPLLRVRANGRLPGARFKADAGGEVKLSLDADLDSNDTVSKVQIVRDGQVVREVPVPAGRRSFALGELSFDQSGWFLVRVIADDVERTLRFASTAPFYVQVGEDKRVSAASAKFFHDWVVERTARVKTPEGEKRDAVLAPHHVALKFWSDRIEAANAP